MYILQDQKTETLSNNYNNRLKTLGELMDGLRGAIKYLKNQLLITCFKIKYVCFFKI